MAHMEWSAELESGIPVIDNQHRQIVDFINKLDEATQNHDASVIGHVVEGVLNYTVTHFELEEELMQQAGFPGLKAHQQAHEFFMRKVAVLRGRFVAGEDVASLLQSMLKGWLVSHIKGEDREYIEAVRKVGGG